ncbi:MAG: hypothetical protein WC043_10980 [Pseudobdellovibrionaceae bacterium]
MTQKLRALKGGLLRHFVLRSDGMTEKKEKALTVVEVTIRARSDAAGMG